MSKHTKNIAKSIITGFALGAAMGIAVRSMRRPKSRLQRNASRTFETIGTIMQNVADMTK